MNRPFEVLHKAVCKGQNQLMVGDRAALTAPTRKRLELKSTEFSVSFCMDENVPAAPQRFANCRLADAQLLRSVLLTNTAYKICQMNGCHIAYLKTAYDTKDNR